MLYSILAAGVSRTVDAQGGRVMATYAVDSARQPMIATGIVNPVDEFEGEKGSRKRTGNQEKTGDGVPVWSVEVSYVTEAFGKQATATAGVTVPAAEKPEPAPFSPIEFAGLQVRSWVNFKSGQQVENWSAEALASFTPANGKPTPAPKPTSGDVKPSGDKTGESKAA